ERGPPAAEAPHSRRPQDAPCLETVSFGTRDPPLSISTDRALKCQGLSELSFRHPGRFERFLPGEEEATLADHSVAKPREDGTQRLSDRRTRALDSPRAPSQPHHLVSAVADLVHLAGVLVEWLGPHSREPASTLVPTVHRV